MSCLSLCFCPEWGSSGFLPSGAWIVVSVSPLPPPFWPPSFLPAHIDSASCLHVWTSCRPPRPDALVRAGYAPHSTLGITTPENRQEMCQLFCGIYPDLATPKLKPWVHTEFDHRADAKRILLYQSGVSSCYTPHCRSPYDIPELSVGLSLAPSCSPPFSGFCSELLPCFSLAWSVTPFASFLPLLGFSVPEEESWSSGTFTCLFASAFPVQRG